MKSRRICSSLAIPALLALSISFAPTQVASAHTNSVRLKSVSKKQLRAICVWLSRPGRSQHITRQRAKHAVESLSVLRRYHKRVPITGSALAKVSAKDPSLVNDRNEPFWVMASKQGPHATELYFVHAKTSTVVTYMALGEGCFQ